MSGKHSLILAVNPFGIQKCTRRELRHRANVPNRSMEPRHHEWQQLSTRAPPVERLVWAQHSRLVVQTRQIIDRFRHPRTRLRPDVIPGLRLRMEHQKRESPARIIMSGSAQETPETPPRHPRKSKQSAAPPSRWASPRHGSAFTSNTTLH